MIQQKIVILGGYGTFGGLIAEALAPSGAGIVVAGRDAVKGQAFADTLNIGFVRCDAKVSDSLSEAIAGASLVINASGPFQARDYSIPQCCIEHGCHYIDLGDGREYVAGTTQLHESAKARNLFVCLGASTSPAITSAAVAELRSGFPHIRSLKIALTAGNRNRAGVSTIGSILAYVGLPVRVWQEGRWQERTGWEMGEFIDFPAPVGRRRVQLCDVPDLELFPSLFEAESVIFKAGVELNLFNYALAVLAQFRRLCPALNLPALAAPLVQLSRLFRSFGTLHGSFAVWIADDKGQERALAFVAPQNGPRLPAAPAVLLARKLIAGEIPAIGAFPCVGLLRLDEFVQHLAPFGIFVVRGANGVWASP